MVVQLKCLNRNRSLCDKTKKKEKKLNTNKTHTTKAVRMPTPIGHSHGMGYIKWKVSRNDSMTIKDIWE